MHFCRTWPAAKWLAFPDHPVLVSRRCPGDLVRAQELSVMRDARIPKGENLTEGLRQGGEVLRVSVGCRVSVDGEGRRPSRSRRRARYARVGARYLQEKLISKAGLLTKTTP